MQHSYVVPLCEKQIKIIYEDEHLLLVDKPEFLLSVPGRRPENHDSVITRLQQDYPTARIAHRLDLDTSGIMVVPLNAGTLSALGRMFQRREIKKEYQALVFGTLRDQHGCIDLPIARDWQHRPRQKIDFIHGKAARTDYQKLSTANEVSSRLLLRPHSGRSHQLRIHLRSVGHPILGCDLYAHEAAYRMAPRLMLHATRLTFAHPITTQLVDVSSPPGF
jgi:tRNA pseudouridine32 synthase/23S rRNA pseudouridine746 synthase